MTVGRGKRIAITAAARATGRIRAEKTAKELWGERCYLTRRVASWCTRWFLRGGMNSPNGQRRNYCGMRKNGTILRAAETRSSVKIHQMERRAIGAREAKAGAVSEMLCIGANARDQDSLESCDATQKRGRKSGIGTPITASIFVSHRYEADD